LFFDVVALLVNFAANFSSHASQRQLRISRKIRLLANHIERLDELADARIHRLRVMRRVVFFFQAEDGIRDATVTGVQTCALPIFRGGGVKRFLVYSPDHQTIPMSYEPPDPGEYGADTIMVEAESKRDAIMLGVA